MGVAPMPASWEASGGGSGGKAELPTLPNGASPLEFGDWLCLCGPIMKDLVPCRWKMVGCYGATSSCLLHGMEGTISSTTSSTLSSSS